MKQTVFARERGLPSYFTSCPLLVGAALVLCVAEAAPDVCAGACGRLPRHHPPVDSSEPPDPSPQVGCGSRASGSATGVSKLKNMAESVRTEPVHLRQPLRTPLHARAATCPALHRCFPHACGLSACSCPLCAPCCPLRTLLLPCDDAHSTLATRCCRAAGAGADAPTSGGLLNISLLRYALSAFLIHKHLATRPPSATELSLT